MERKGQRKIRRQRRSRSWLFSPMVIAQLVVVMMLAGVGVAFAMDAPTTITSTTASPWAGTASITSAANVTVGGYTLGFTDELDAVDKITLNGSSDESYATLQWSVLDEDVSVQNGSVTQTFAATWTLEVDINPDLPLDQVDALNIIITK